MNSFLSYLGGKSLLTKKIIPLIPDHKCYVEVFGGAGWLLFRKEESQVEIINDINADLATLYRVVKFHLDEFVRYFRWLLVSREEFERFKKAEPSTLTDIQRAVRFYYLLRNSYGSRVVSPSFSINTTRPSNFNLLRIEESLSEAHLRLARVYIENRPYQKVIERFDKKDTFFYIDPPYWNCESAYGKGIFRKEDFEMLRTLLKKLQGKFIMSINATPEIREIYDGFHIVEVTTNYCVRAREGKKVTELLVMNYDPEQKSNKC